MFRRPKYSIEQIEYAFDLILPHAMKASIRRNQEVPKIIIDSMPHLKSIFLDLLNVVKKKGGY